MEIPEGPEAERFYFLETDFDIKTWGDRMFGGFYIALRPI